MTDMAHPSTNVSVQPAGVSRIGEFLRTYYIYFVLVIVIVVLSSANLDKFDLFERGNFLNKNNAADQRVHELLSEKFQLFSGVFGASNDQDLGLLSVNADTGLPDESGIQLRPEHVMATLVQSLGGDPSPYREPPLTAWIDKELTP